MRVVDGYIDIEKLAPFKYLREAGLPLLKESIETFLNCKVTFLLNPVEQVRTKYGVTLSSGSEQGCYPIDDDTFLIYARILDADEPISGLGILLKGKPIGSYRGIIQVLEKAVTDKMSSSYKKDFTDCSSLFGDEIIIHTIANYSVQGHIDYQAFQHLLLFFQKLKSTTFEGKSFSTGLVITKAHYTNTKRGKGEPHREIVPLAITKNIKSTLEIDRRFWYLVDGKHTYFVANKDLEIQHMMVMEPTGPEQEYVDSNALSATLQTGDVMFRVENEKQFSILCSDGVEFVYLENRWRIRDYNIIKSYIHRVVADKRVVDRILYFALYCSRRGISAVIWVPENISSIQDFVKPESLHTLVYQPVSISEVKYVNQILRYISSDGAAVIDSKGYLRYFGCIVDTSKLRVTEIKGTGEAAAEVLSRNGLSIKISHDGTIKLFLPDEDKPILI
ncbi:hypothetical protein ACSX1A_18675 [Pontibacter sp. MBLB2868]|uniref:hypothetical protein n=1 Tax=Pontibacter sp. MBLB2868 TaxID=3451555 RepID=UPI003F7533CE